MIVSSIDSGDGGIILSKRKKTRILQFSNCSDTEEDKSIYVSTRWKFCLFKQLATNPRGRHHSWTVKIFLIWNTRHERQFNISNETVDEFLLATVTFKWIIYHMCTRNQKSRLRDVVEKKFGCKRIKHIVSFLKLNAVFYRVGQKFLSTCFSFIKFLIRQS